MRGRTSLILAFNGCTSHIFPPTVHSVFNNALGNDPSAGSPTETLLRLLLPLNAQV